MANEASGVELLLKHSNGVVEGQDEASLNWERGSENAPSKDGANYVDNIALVEEWNIDFSGWALFGSTPSPISGSDFKINVSDGTNFNELQGFRSCTITLNQEFANLGNGTAGNTQIYKPNYTRSLEISFERVYTDPSVDAAYKTLIDTVQSTNSYTEINLGGITGLSFGPSTAGTTENVNVNNMTIDGPGDDAATQTISFNWKGSFDLTDSTNQGTGLNNFLTDFNDQASSTALIEYVDPSANTPVAGYYSYSGTTFVSSLEITIPWDGIVQLSGSLQGTGDLAINTQT